MARRHTTNGAGFTGFPWLESAARDVRSRMFMKTNQPVSLVAVALVTLVALTSVACSDGDDGGYYPPSSPSSPSGAASNGTNTTTTGTGDEHPSWLVGPAYTKGYKTENNIAYESEDVGIKFGGAPDFKYEEKTGKTWSKSGTWKVSKNDLILSVNSETLPLATALKANCRIFTRGSRVLFTSEDVKSCPFEKPLSAAECAKVGSYSKGTQSGSSSSSYSTSSTYVLDPDGVVSFTTGSSRSTCYSTTCKSVASSTAPVVGRWWLSGSTVQSDAATKVDLTGYDFSPSTDKCPR
jgi:hypothetical protein